MVAALAPFARLSMARLLHTRILAYAANLLRVYGPFRDAVVSSRSSAVPKKTPIRWTQEKVTKRYGGRLDLAEGSDRVMIKPACRISNHSSRQG